LHCYSSEKFVIRIQECDRPKIRRSLRSARLGQAHDYPVFLLCSSGFSQEHLIQGGAQVTFDCRPVGFIKFLSNSITSRRFLCPPLRSACWISSMSIGRSNNYPYGFRVVRGPASTMTNMHSPSISIC